MFNITNRGNPVWEEIIMDEIKLKPCPYCGGKAVFDVDCCGAVVACLECDIVFATAKMNTSEKQLAEAWNRRAEHG